MVALTRLQRLEAVCPLYVEMARQAVHSDILVQQRDRIVRAQRVGADTGKKGERDFGPSIRTERRDVVTEYRADPDPTVGPLIHGGRVRDGLHAMLRHKQITLQQYAAADRFRDDIDGADGITLDRVDNLGIRSTRGDSWPADRQIILMQRVRAAWIDLPGKLGDVTQFVVVRGGTVGDYALAFPQRREKATEVFKQALDVLVLFYEGRL